MAITIWNRLFPPKIVEKIVYVETPPETIVLPVKPSITKAQHMETLDRILSTADGKMLLRIYEEKYLGALAMSCPRNLVTPEQRSAWLAAYDALVKVRRELMDDLKLNVERLKKIEPTETIPPVTGPSGEFDL